MKNRLCMVTGANTGIGKATALGLARVGAQVVMVCRSRRRGESAREEIAAKSGNETVELLIADLSSQSAIRQLARAFEQRWPALHVLVNNAGIICRQREVSKEDVEIQFAVNHLAPFLLTHLLVERLRAAAPARIVNVASQVHRGASIDFADLQSEKDYRPSDVYARTKLANILFTYELARRLKGSGVTANCLHPGVVATNMLADYMGVPRALRFGTRLAGVSPSQGAKTSIYLASAAEVESVSGKYFVNCQAVSSSPQSYDQAVAAQLWQISCQLTGLPLT